MSEVLARIRVKEEHGIRRFLYPLSTLVPLPKKTDTASLSLTTTAGEPVPLQMTRSDEEHCRLDFAVSLAPLQPATELILSISGPQLDIPDPLNLTHADDGKLRSVQERFEANLGGMSQITKVMYDGISHLEGASEITRTDYFSHPPRYQDRGRAAPDYMIRHAQTTTGGGALGAWSETQGRYSDNCPFVTRTELTACKSWAKMTHCLKAPRREEEVVFRIPMTVNAPVLIFDTGVGNGIYGKVQPDYTHIIWRNGPAQLRWASGTIQGEGGLEYNNYRGVTERREDFEAQRWFHVIDSKKAIAVAITALPDTWDMLSVALTPTGRICINFSASHLSGPTHFGICYHFLNDIPAIAAATNPQSILLPPTVEVLPA